MFEHRDRVADLAGLSFALLQLLRAVGANTNAAIQPAARSEPVLVRRDWLLLLGGWSEESHGLFRLSEEIL